MFFATVLVEGFVNKTTVDFVDTQNPPEGVTNTTNFGAKTKTSIILTCAK